MFNCVSNHRGRTTVVITFGYCSRWTCLMLIAGWYIWCQHATDFLWCVWELLIQDQSHWVGCLVWWKEVNSVGTVQLAILWHLTVFCVYCWNGQLWPVVTQTVVSNTAYCLYLCACRISLPDSTNLSRDSRLNLNVYNGMTSFFMNVCYVIVACVCVFLCVRVTT